MTDREIYLACRPSKKCLARIRPPASNSRTEPDWSVKNSIMRATIIISTLLAAMALSGCESKPQWTSGNYEVYSMGGPSELEFGVDVGGGIQGLVNPQVAGIGEDSLWIVVKQYPNGDKAKTANFYLPKRSSNEQRKGMDVDAVKGPFSETEFAQKTAELKLPPFSRFF